MIGPSLPLRLMGALPFDEPFMVDAILTLRWFADAVCMIVKCWSCKVLIV